MNIKLQIAIKVINTPTVINRVLYTPPKSNLHIPMDTIFNHGGNLSETTSSIKTNAAINGDVYAMYLFGKKLEIHIPKQDQKAPFINITKNTHKKYNSILFAINNCLNAGNKYSPVLIILIGTFVLRKIKNKNTPKHTDIPPDNDADIYLLIAYFRVLVLITIKFDILVFKSKQNEDEYAKVAANLIKISELLYPNAYIKLYNASLPCPISVKDAK